VGQWHAALSGKNEAEVNFAKLSAAPMHQAEEAASVIAKTRCGCAPKA